MKRIRLMVPAVVLLAGLMSSPADAGWGVHRSSGYGASSGGASSGYASYSVGSYGSSGGSYGSSGGRSHGSSGGSYGSSGGSYGSSGGSYGSSGGSSGGPGLLTRIHDAVHSAVAAKRARHTARRSHGSSGYSSHGSSGYSSYNSSGYASYNSSGYASYRRSYASHGSSGSSGTVRYSVPSYSSNGSSGYASSGYSSSSYSYAVPQNEYHSQSIGSPVYSDYSQGSVIESYPQGTVIEGSIIEGSVIEGGHAVPEIGTESAPAPVKEAVKEAVPTEARIHQDAALITLAVAADARVTVNGHLTTSEGPIRQFMSRGLKNGFTYTYDIVVETVVDGAPQQQTQTLRLRAGDTERLVFNAPVSDKIETALVILVPEDAQVVLAGNATKATGAERVYRTKQLTQGQVWEGYEVTATIVRDGREITQKQVLRLEAGSERKLVFDFDNEADLTLASR